MGALTVSDDDVNAALEAQQHADEVEWKGGARAVISLEVANKENPGKDVGRDGGGGKGLGWR